MRRLLTALIVGLALCAGPASAQDVSSVIVRPTDTVETDPHGGTWFFSEVPPGGNTRLRATIANPADVPQEVSLDVRDLIFENDQGQLRPGSDEGIGLWAQVSEPRIVVDPEATRIVEVTVNVPPDAEPGDHIGAFVARTTNIQNGTEISRQVANRFYITVPGDARQELAIDEIDVEYDFWLWPSTAHVTAVISNTGNVRVRPNVTIRGSEAEGASILLSMSSEHYVSSFSLPWYPTILKLPAVVTLENGLTRTATTTRIVFPLGLFILLVVAGSAGYAGRRWWKKRKSATAELKQDIQRLEQLITQQAKAQESTAAVGTGLPATELPEDEEAIFLAALKRARRSDDDTALARIALAKHLTSGGGLDLVLEALEEHDGKHRDALLDAAVSYGADALSTHERFDQLSDGTQAELGERLVTAGEPVSGNGNGKPAKVPQPVVGQTDSDVLRNELAKVKGVGPAKQEALVSRFGSLDAIRSAEVEDLTDVPGIGYATAREILDQLNG